MTEDLRSGVLMCKSTLNVVERENKDKIWDNLKDMEGRDRESNIYKKISRRRE